VSVGSSKRRILFHPYFFFPEAWNGIDEHLRLLAKYLDPAQFELMVLEHTNDGPQTALLAARAAIRLIAAPEPGRSGPAARLMALRSLYARERVDVLHFHSPVAGGQSIPAVAARLAGVPLTLATYHQIQPARLPRRTRMVNAVTHTLLVDKTIAVSRDVQQTLARATGVPARRVSVIHNGIDPVESTGSLGKLPTRREGEVWIGYFGRLSPEKGVGGLLGALAVLPSDGPPIRTLIVGDGPERAALVAAAERLGVSNRVAFLGFRSDARKIMEQVDMVVHVPVYEGFGLVVVEAMAASRAVVVNDAPGGLPEIAQHGETGIVVPAGDAHALARALASLALDPEARARMGRAGRARYERLFSARAMAERTAELYG
jgi:glycosyltransferase involved in cell wall biosynthesis